MTYKLNFKFHITLLVVFIFYSCNVDNLLDPKLPEWEIDVEVPLLEKAILLRENILDIDSSIVIYPDINTQNEFDSIFVYQLTEQIDSTFIDDKLNIQDVIDTTITQSVDDITVEDVSFIEVINFSDVGIGSVSSSLSTEIGLINLNDIAQQDSEPYTLQNLLPDFYTTIQNFLDTSGDPDLGNQPYNEDLLGSIDNQAINPTSNTIEFSSFQYANFDSGNLNITIDNSLMYLDFQDIIIQLQDANNDNILNNINLGSMNGGQIYNEVIVLGDLPNDGYLPNNINIIISGIVSGVTEGATYNQLLNSQIEIPISATNLIVEEASAQIPAQNFDDNGSFVLENENKILEAVINSGFLTINLENNLPENLDANINISIPNILDSNNNELVINFDIADSFNPINLNNYKIIIENVDNQQIFYSYSVSTSSTEDYTVINQSDNININFELVGDINNDDQQITFSSINGIIENQEQNISGDIDLEIDGATIQDAIFSSGEIVVDIINNISNAPLDIDIVINEILFEGTPFSESIMLSGSYNQTFSLENHVLSPTYIDDIAKVFYNAVATSSNESANQYNLEEDITVNLSIQNIEIKEVTGYFNQDPIIETNTVTLESDNIIEEGVLESGNIEITINNNLGLLANINFSIEEILDANGNSFSYTIPLENNQEIVNIDLSEYSINLDNDINSDSYQTISYTSEVVINSEEVITLDLENNIEIRFDIPELTFSYIKGYIAPVEVEIAPFSKSDLSILPDDVQNITFNSASAYLDFDSNLDLDFLLQLDFYSKNTNSGEEFSFQFLEQTTTSVDRIYLDAEQILNMINIVPDSISVSGLATVSGDGIINSTDVIAAEFTIEVPFEFIFTDDTIINVSSSEISDNSIPEMFENMILYYQYSTPFDFNTYLSIYCSDDTTTIINDPNKFLDFELISSENSIIDSIEISANKFDLLNSSSFIKPVINVISTTDQNEDFIPQSFYSTDSLSIKLWGKFGLIINENE